MPLPSNIQLGLFAVPLTNTQSNKPLLDLRADDAGMVLLQIVNTGRKLYQPAILQTLHKILSEGGRHKGSGISHKKQFRVRGFCQSPMCSLHDQSHIGGLPGDRNLVGEALGGQRGVCRRGQEPLAGRARLRCRSTFRLALEKGQAGARYHAVAEECVALRDIAEVIGAGLKMPVESVSPEQAQEYFGSSANLAQIDLAASGALTRQEPEWNHTGRAC